MKIRPDYYKDGNGHDLFWKMEHGKYPAEQSIGFCRINAAKYRRRIGRKTINKTDDLNKALTYQDELIKLKRLKYDGVIK